MIITVIALSIGFIFIEKHKIDHLHDLDDSEPFGILNALAMNLLHLGQLGYPLSKNTLTSRVLLLSSCLSSFILYSFYTADLTSLMTSGSKSYSIRSFHDAYEMGVEVALWGGSGIQTLVE